MSIGLCWFVYKLCFIFALGCHIFLFLIKLFFFCFMLLYIHIVKVIIKHTCAEALLKHLSYRLEVGDCCIHGA